MSRIPPVDSHTTNDDIRENFDAVQTRLGGMANMMRTMAQSPSALEGYLALATALRHGLLPARVQEQLALVIAEANECDYSLSAHTAWGRSVGLSSDEVVASREGRASDRRVEASLQFARALVERRGDVSDQELARVREAGFTDGKIAEIIAHVALNVFANYFNRAAQTDIDFPKVTASQLV